MAAAARAERLHSPHLPPATGAQEGRFRNGAEENVGMEEGRDMMQRSSTYGSKNRTSASIERLATWMRTSSMTRTQQGWGSRFSRLSMSATFSKMWDGPSEKQARLRQEKHAVGRARDVTKHLKMGLPGVAKGFDNLGEFVRYHRANWDNRGRSEDDDDEEDSAEGNVALPDLLPLSDLKNADPNVEIWNSSRKSADQLHDAVSNNDAISVWRLTHASKLLDRVHPDALNEDGETAAVQAAKGGQVIVCSMLLDARADPLARDKNPRFFADGVWPNESKPDERGADSEDRPAERCGRTVVYLLRLKGLLEEVLSRVFPMTRVGIARAVSEGIEAFHLTPALIVAATAGNAELMAFLLTHVAAQSDRKREFPIPLESPSSTRMSGFSRQTSEMTWSLPQADERAEALLAAIQRKHYNCANVLISSGVPRSDINVRRDKRGRTALHLAAMIAEPQLVRKLLEAAAVPVTFSQTGRQPLHDAITMGRMEVVQALLDFHADPREKVKEQFEGSPFKNKDAGCSALHLAHKRGKEKILALLLSHVYDKA